MAHAVRYSAFGGPDVLEVVEVPTPEPGEGEVLVEVFATGLNPVESSIRRGEHPERWPVELPAAQGRDLAGVVIATGPGASRFGRGDEVMGFVDHGAQATHVVVPEANLMPRPPALSWEVAGSLYTAGTMAWDAVEGLGLGPNDTVVITAAAGGVGCLAAQFARLRGATVIGTSAEPRFDFLRQFGVIPTGYGPGLADRVRAITSEPVSAFIDFLGGQAGEAKALGVPASRILTVLDWDAVHEHGIVRIAPGDVVALGRVAALAAARRIRLPIADIFSLDSVADAYRALDKREAPGKIVLGLRVVEYPGQRVREPELKEQDVTLGVLTPHAHMDVEEAIPPAIADGSVRRRHREEHEREEHEREEHEREEHERGVTRR
ncbi:NADP-dependent oxidoreductase [Agromyces sp. H66]|uniref:NADP-dependent oxidoreductase n=1 Tax=Agromyces sp. H66 TaxID=2529859 RepID=UPI001B7D7CCB|nr:NADP-dependent oxidoreductase [Agromyces sp. H66]